MTTAKPIIKWAGGKGRQVATILAALPEQMDVYHEPFFGGGAVFFALAAAKRFKRAIISDSNKEVIETLRTVREDVEGVIAELEKMKPEKIGPKKFARIRKRRKGSPAYLAARMIFLNHTTYNGLYRLNLKGRFNAPWGKVKHWKPNYANLRAVSEVLHAPNIEIVRGDFAKVTSQLDLFQGSEFWGIYLDPPYIPKSKSSNFTKYNKEGFTNEDHARLARYFAARAEAGVHVVASNSDTALARELYGAIPGTEIREVQANRAINSKGAGRGKVCELLMVNRGQRQQESAA